MEIRLINSLLAKTHLCRAVALLILLPSLLVLAACSDTDAGEGSTAAPTAPAATEAPPAATVTPTSPPPDTPVPATPTPAPAPTATPVPPPAPTEPPTVEPANDGYPMQIVDVIGRPVTIEAPPQRIVSLSPTGTEMLYAAGGTAIARDTGSVYPSEVLELPDVGGAYAPNFEAIASHRGDLILIEALTQSRFIEPLSQLGAPVVAVRATSKVDILAGVGLLGRIIGEEETAALSIHEIEARISSATEGLSTGKSALILIADADRNFYAAKPESYPGSVATLVKLSNPAADLPDSGTFPGFAQVSGEQIFALNADYLFTITPAPAPAPRLSAMLPRIPGFANLPAIASGRLHELDHIIFLRNQGPRIADAVEILAELVEGTP